MNVRHLLLFVSAAAACTCVAAAGASIVEAELLLGAMVQAQAAPQLAGKYSVQGRNPDGTPYNGRAVIAVRDDGRYEFVWFIGVLQRGVGTLVDDTLTVDFGDEFPAIYKVQTDGSLQGTWADGRATEELTPVGVLRT